MKKLQILTIGIVFLFGVSVGHAGDRTENSLDLLAPSDTTQTITQTGNYRITVRGADGGNSNAGSSRGGTGATLAATFALQTGDVLTLVTGIAGGDGSSSNGAGGGGGSAVILNRGGTKTLLIVAGAGAGAGLFSGGSGSSAQGTASGGAGNAGGGGGGFNADGGDGLFCSNGGVRGTVNAGGAGGMGNTTNNNGGYGFGGGAGSCNGAGAGGGGYGGGDGSDISGSRSEGGSSFVHASGSSITRVNGIIGNGNNQNGSVRVASPSAAPVLIGGRVLASDGGGLSGAVVRLTDTNGNTRTVRTNPFGYYRFADVGAGQTVVVAVFSKLYTFEPQVLTVMEEFNELNFAPVK